jgi:hypothetical protein
MNASREKREIDRVTREMFAMGRKKSILTEKNID